jgi:hypothetical protein
MGYRNSCGRQVLRFGPEHTWLDVLQQQINRERLRNKKRSRLSRCEWRERSVLLRLH